MPKTSFKQKTFLFLIGIALTLILLEFVLRLGGWVFDYRLSKRNIVSQEEDEIRILCIGESTTALGGEDSYPSQLEQILNSKGLEKKFKVINKGMVSKTSEDILRELDKNLDAYNPRYVVSMIGVNDYTIDKGKLGFSLKIERLLKHFRVYKFFSLLKKHMSNIGKPKHVPVVASEHEETDDLSKVKVTLDSLKEFNRIVVTLESLEGQLKNDVQRSEVEVKKRQVNDQIMDLNYRLGLLYRRVNDYSNSIAYLKKSLKGNDDDAKINYELGMVLQQENRCTEAILFFKKSIDIFPTVKSYQEMARCFSMVGKNDIAANLYMLVIETKPEIGRTYLEIGKWFELQNKFEQAEEIYKKGVEKKQPDYFLYDALISLYERMGKHKDIKVMEAMAKKYRKTVQRYVLTTEKNYNVIADVIRSKENTQLIAMQYPIRKIEDLKKIFWSKDDIVFVENKFNFDQALKKQDYFELFSDYFAFDFGHCTRKGNRLIAQNMANTILELENDRKNK